MGPGLSVVNPERITLEHTSPAMTASGLSSDERRAPECAVSLQKHKPVDSNKRRRVRHEVIDIGAMDLGVER